MDSDNDLFDRLRELEERHLEVGQRASSLKQMSAKLDHEYATAADASVTAARKEQEARRAAMQCGHALRDALQELKVIEDEIVALHHQLRQAQSASSPTSKRGREGDESMWLL